MIRIVFTDNTDLPENRQKKCLDCLRKNKAGEVAVTYASGTSSASVSVRTDPADLPETSFGLQLLALLRLYGRSVYVP